MNFKIKMKEEQEIFSNYVFLTFHNKNVNDQYNLKNKDKILKFNKISFALLSLLSICVDIILIIKRYPTNVGEVNKKKIFYYILLISSSVLTIFQILLFILTFVFNKKVNVQIAFSCLSYCFITLEFTILKVMIEVIFLSDWQDYFFLNIIDYLVRIMIHFLGIVEFIQSIVINILLTGLILTLYYAVDSVNSIISDSGATFIILNLGLVLCSYFITRSSKNTFFYCYEIEDLNRKKDSILNNLNTGYMRVKNNEIKFMNIALVNTVKNTKAINSAVSSSSNNITNSTRVELEIGDEWLYNHKEFIYDILFSGISPPKVNFYNNLIDERINTNTTMLYESFMREIAECYKKISKDNAFSSYKTPYSNSSSNTLSKFIFLDYHNLTMASGKKITYEISYRYDYDEYEFIFNDITRTKEFEHKEYDIKIKNIFLTKIAHEFKNPLVCLTELITQIKEFSIDNKILDNKCNLGKWLCEYLLILIKDLDYFSLENGNITCGTAREKISVDSLVQFCLAIGNRRIKILEKEKYINFISHVDDDVPKEIYGDDVKLKQVLLNLISNSIKFTSKGNISLNISKENDSLRFTVNDTGKGISKELQKTLLNSSNVDKVENGVGLTIVRELTSLIGNEIRFLSEENKGSSFWFTIPINGISRDVSPSRKLIKKLDSNLSVLNSSNSTVKVDTFNLELGTPYHQLKTEPERVYNIIVTDDEDLARKALIRVLKEAAKKLHIRINFLEANDGMELLYLVYDNCINNNNPIDGIISDQTMHFINGSVCQQILCNCTNIKKLIPFFIVTAYDVNATYFKDLNIEGIFSKPLRKCDAENILSHFIT